MEKRKRGRPGIPSNIEEYCITAAMKYPDMKRIALFYKVEKELKEQALTPPGKDKMLKLFQKAPKGGKEDEQWSIAKSIEYGLPPEATGDLLSVKAYCLAAGREFSIRQAKWLCYIHTCRLVPSAQEHLQTSYLYSISALYANRERICLALNIDIDTYDLDAFVGLPQAEAITALKTGVLDKNRFRIFSERLTEANIDKITTNYWDVTKTVLDDLGFRNEIPSFYSPLHKRPVLDEELFPTEELDHLNAYWLRFFSKAPNWPTLSHQQQINIILKLQHSIEVEAKKEDRRKINQYLIVGWWEPTGLLKELGHAVEDYRYGFSIDNDANTVYSQVGQWNG